MSENLTKSSALRFRRIHALAQVAHEQREQLRVQAIGLAAGIRDSNGAQTVISGIQQARHWSQALSLFGQGWGRGSSSTNKAAAFPWNSAASTVGGLWALFRWWKQTKGRK